MHAVARLTSFDPAKLAAAGDALEQFDQAHRTQPGYAGTVVVELHEGRRLILNLWDSEEHSTAALSVLGPDVERALTPLMSDGSELIGVGTVTYTDLIPSPRS